MVAKAALPLRVLLYEGPGSRTLTSQRRFEILQALLKKGYQVTRPRARLESDGGVAPADGSDILVLAEKNGDDALPAMASGEATDGSVTVHFRDIAGVGVDDVVELVDGVQGETLSYRPGEWKPWFPVIDYQRCTNCMQCLSFCLFDVYGVDSEQNIQVKNPDKCKTNCPACSRVCPDVAILFPKYGAGPINGDEVNQEDVDREKMKVDISALLGGDIYSMLRERHADARSRFSRERDENKALKERMRCLKKLGEAMDIPPEVMTSLPSMEEIQSKAKRAQQEAKAVLGRRAERAQGGET